MAQATVAGTTGRDSSAAARSSVVGALETGVSTATASSNAATCNGMAGVVTTDSITTAAAATYSLTVTNNQVTVGDVVQASVMNGSNTTGTPTIATVSETAGAFTAVVQNIHSATAFGGTLKVKFIVVKNIAAPAYP